VRLPDSTTSTNIAEGYLGGVLARVSTTDYYPVESFFSQVTSLGVEIAPDILRPARFALRFVDNLEISTLAESVLKKLSFWLSQIDDLHRFPPIRLFQAEDESVLIEWAFTHFRIGFSLEQNPVESGWFLVSDESVGSISASGRLNEANLDWIVTWLLCAVTRSESIEC
jgi:hypothetical protein